MVTTFPAISPILSRLTHRFLMNHNLLGWSNYIDMLEKSNIFLEVFIKY